MLCYRDMTFCASDCVNKECFRHWDNEKQADAERWWGGPDAPIAWSDFSPSCDEYKAPVAQLEEAEGSSPS